MFGIRKIRRKSIAETLLQPPAIVSYIIEYRREGIRFAHDGSGLYTNTEISKDGDTTIKSTVNFYKHK